MYYTPYSAGSSVNRWQLRTLLRCTCNPQQAQQAARRARLSRSRYTPMGFVPLPYRRPIDVGTARREMYITPINQAQAAQPQVASGGVAAAAGRLCRRQSRKL